MMSGPAGRGSVRITRREKSGARTVKAIHGVREVAPDPQFELDLAADLRGRLGSDPLLDALMQYADGSRDLPLHTSRRSRTANGAIIRNQRSSNREP
jgi:hypothetical protein